jgi:hypothetical protein
MPSPVVQALMPPQVNPAHPPQGFWGNAGRFAYDALGLREAAKALRGQMTDAEARDFFFGAAAGMIPMGRGLKAVAPAVQSQAMKPSLALLDAFDWGRRVRDAAGTPRPGRGFYEKWAYGGVPSLPEKNFDIVASWEGSAPNKNAFYLSGLMGDELPVFATGSRYGNAPSGGRSYNYREQIFEPGVSMAKVEHPNFKDWEWFDAFNKNRPIVPYEGYLLPMKGSDDEPLMVALRKLGMVP